MMITRNQTKIKTVLILAAVAMALFGLTTASLAASDVISVNFYHYGKGGVLDETEQARLRVEGGEAAGVGDWNTTDWNNFLAATGTNDISNSQGSSATMDVIRTRNASPYWWAQPRTTLLNDPDADLMDSGFSATEDSDLKFEMTVSSIPYAYYDVVFYFRINQAQYNPGTGKYVFNGGPVQSFTFPGNSEFSAFDDISDDGTGNYIVFSGVSGASFTILVWGDVFAHLGPAGFQIRDAGIRNPSPADGTDVSIGNVDLSWMNMDPNYLSDSVYVDVWFGTDPDPKNGAQVVTAGQDTTTVQVSAPAQGNYYWQVVNYIKGPDHINEPNAIAGPVWSFHAVDDLAPTSVDAGVDMLTWTGQPVSLDATVVDDGVSPLTYLWTADPADGVVFDPSAAVEDPTVTITKPVWIDVTVPNPGFEERETFDPFDDGVDKYNQWALESWRHFEVDNNGGPLRIWNPGAPGATPQGAITEGFEGNAAEGKYVVLVRSRYNDDEMPEIRPIRDWEAAVQLLDETFVTSASYKLTAKVGRPPDHDYFGYALQLAVGGTNVGGATYQGRVDGGTVIAQDDNTLTIDPNNYVTSTVEYTPDPANDHLTGLPLQIRLCALENPDDHSLTGWVVFDDVELSTDKPYDVHTVTLTLAVNDEGNPTPVEDTMTIDVYDDACKMARIGLGLADITDLDNNCITDLRDYALLAAEWLVDKALTAPVAKP